eukprot:Phypoly_transcript_04003.p1 GENE.Phypoly_transcript_04003~~Phypoly_transcript_04003.p1  ORF type:complete len:681 (+),score=94.37 Phypoly_transcript_04003:110-2152(+)
MIELEKTTPSSPLRGRGRRKGEEVAGLLENEEPANPPQHFTWRSVIAGVLIGGLMCFSNMYFGLQTGWVTMGSLQSTILGFLLFRLLTNFLTRHKIYHLSHFTYLENVVLQTAAVATATMPLAGGFVGIIPALASINHPLNYWQLTLWAMGVAFFGVFFAVPLRTQTILREKLKFPSGTATAQMIHTLHKLTDPMVPSMKSDKVKGEFAEVKAEESDTEEGKSGTGTEYLEEEEVEDEKEAKEWSRKINYLLASFLCSSAILFATYFIPVLGNMPVMTWIGLPVLTMFSWTFTPSLSYVGQGMIMGPKTGVSMILGALFGWGLLAPMARHKGWAPGPVDNWKTGAKGWIMWTSLAIMLGESLSSLTVIGVKAARSYYDARKLRIDREKYGVEASSALEEEPDPAPPSQQVPKQWWILGLIASSLLCMCTVSPMFGMPFHEPLIAVVFACLTSVLAVRALGETDLNPVSGIGKMSQIVFAGVAPGNVVANLIAGAISEAGAQQAGDLMQDLKTGHLLRASPRAQFYAQMIGSFFSVFFTVAAYQLYSTAYQIPSDTLPAPTAAIWLDMAELVNGGSLPENVVYFCIILGIIAALFPILTAIFPTWESFLPSCVAFAVAMYVTPNWTIARVIGSFVDYLWKKKSPLSHEKYMILVASGFVLGEGITSILTAVMKTFNVPYLH